jgi:hypothetical protein
MKPHHIHQWRWDHQHHIPRNWWDRGYNGIKSPNGVRNTDEIYACECGGRMIVATRLTLDDVSTWKNDKVISF